MEDMDSLSAALKWAKEASIEEWVHGFLCTSGHNEEFSLGLKKQAAVCAQADLPPLTVSYQVGADLC